MHLFQNLKIVLQRYKKKKDQAIKIIFDGAVHFHVSGTHTAQ